jgi:hypothetical protein
MEDPVGEPRGKKALISGGRGIGVGMLFVEGRRR